MDHDVTVNDEGSSIAIGGVGFQFIRKICWGGHFSGIVNKILRSGNIRCRFCDGNECIYTLNDRQRLSRIQGIPVPLEKINASESEDNASVYFPEEEHSNGEDSDEDETIDDLLKVKIINSRNVTQKRNKSVKYCNGKNEIHT